MERVHTKGKLQEFARSYGEHRYAIVFYSLLLTLCAVPVLAVFHVDARLVLLFVALNLVTAACGVTPGRGKRFLLVLTGMALALRVVSELTHSLALGSVALVFWALLAVVTAVSAVRFAMRNEDVGPEHLYAALSTYVLGGVFFGVVYAALEKAWPGSLVVASSAVASGELTLSTAIYFSFITMATVGYGDIVPGTDVLRGVAMFQAIGGQIYIAVMIARLVALYVQRKSARSPR